MSHELRRRTFLQALTVASAKILTGCALTEASSSESDMAEIRGGGKEVVVLGGGLAGLCTAYELQKRGFKILAILEAQARTGGRVHTLRNHFADGQYAELGATRIADSHNFTLAYAQQFGLELRELSSGNGLYNLRGQTFVHEDGKPWPDFIKLRPEDREKGADSLVLGYENLDELGDPKRTDWPTGKALEYDALTIRDYLKSKGADDTVFMIDKAINGTELDFDAALYWLMADVVDKAWDKTFGIRGGNDQLPAAFTTALGDVVKRGCIVQSLAQDKGGVSVTYAQEGIARTLRADLAICSLPFTTLRKVDLGGAGFSKEKSALIGSMRYMPVSRFNQQFKTRFWKEKGIGGLKVARTDTPIERLWHMTNVQDGDRGILTAYMMGQNGLAFAKTNEKERSEYFAKHVRTFFPEIDGQMEKSAVKIWQDDPWVGGGWAYYQKGELGQGMPLSKKREGRVFFCGEHTSPWSGWMQGAFESANRVVAEITNGA